MCSPTALPISPVFDIHKISDQLFICNVKNHKDDPTIVLSSTFGVDLERRMLDKILYVLVGKRRYAA
jgi:hypothetical protein